MGEIIGYARACLNDQNLSRQTNELKELGCKQIFYDKLSGTNNKLNGLNECIEALQPTDTLVVWRLDCLSKSISHLVSLINQLRKRGVHFKSIHDAVIDTRTPSGELIFEIFAVLSQVDQTLFTEMSLNRFKSANTSIDKPPYRWRRQRVFISSTFRDMHAERDYLVKYVFPDLRLWCEQYKIHLVDIDLRWGVTAAEVQSGKVIDICMEQIEGSRPFFICILGDRYGWVPSDDEIPESTVSTYEYLRHKKGFSVTHLEIHHAVLSSLKSFDSLEELPLSFFYFRKGLPSPKSIQGFTAKDESAYARTFFESDQKNSIKLNQLKEQILEHYKKIGRIKDNPYEVEEHIFNYTPTFDPSLQNPEDNKLKGRLTKASLREFGDRVKRDLQKAIAYQYHVRIEALSETHEENTLETELDLHEAFIENRVRLFIGRTELLQKLHAYVEGASNSILAIYGPPGCGKSSLLAKFYVELVESEYSQLSIASNQIIIPHFIGASPRSTSLQNLLKRMCGEIKKLSNIDEKIPSDTNKLSIAFNSLLAKAKNRVIIIIDGLNQLDGFNNSYDFKWLPSHLPKNVKIIVSTLEGDTKNTLEIKTKNRLFVSLLQDIERREIIKGMPSLFSKTLDDQHIDAILARDETRNPLFLKIALDELRLFGSFENIEKKIREFPGTIEELFQDVLTRLEIDHGKNNVERFFCLLECSRYGLTGKELNDLLSDDEEKNHIVILRQVRDFFHNRGELIDFFHRGLSKAIRIKYLDGHRSSQLCNGKNSTQYWHNLLAKYFMAQPLFLDDERVKTINSRKCSEQPWHLINSNRWEEVNGTLCDLVFVDAKIRAGFVHDLQEDYLRALQNDRQSEANDEIKLFYYTLIQNLDLIQSYPDYSFQWLFNSLWWKGDVCLEKLHKAKETYIKSGNSFLRQYRIPKKIEKLYFQHSIQKLSTGMACTFVIDHRVQFIFDNPTFFAGA